MEYDKIRIVQSRGPTIEAEARLLASDTFEVRRDGTAMTLEVWETQGGALIAVTRGEVMQGGEVRDIVEATVVGPIGDPLSIDELDHQTMRFAVMGAFDWSDRARSMVRKQLKWSLKQVVE